jgi:hypothetical protein
MATTPAPAPAMPQNARRKRLGVYYTPPEFTRLIVDRTLGRLIDQRVRPLSDPALRAEALRGITVCDPACGDGAFLAAAYDRLADEYERVVRALRESGRPDDATTLAARYGKDILEHNLYGVDLSPKAVAAARRALSARPGGGGPPPPGLSRHVARGNSLVSDRECHPAAFRWHGRFPRVFGGGSNGFDCVIGNPPWERLKLQEREFFSAAAPHIAAATGAARRRVLVTALERSDARLWERYRAARDSAALTLRHVRTGGRFPLTGRADVNAYAVFAELSLRLVAPGGWVGLLVPSGIATDDSTRGFFAALVRRQALVALYDFENRRKVFPDVDGRFKFSLLLLRGAGATTPVPEFVFYARGVEELCDPGRRVELSAEDFKLLNPNTRTCPVFRTRRDAALTRDIYRRVPVLVDRGAGPGGNPWGASFLRMFDQTNDADLFHTAPELRARGLRPEGNRFVGRGQTYLPLYEAKMIRAFDHRAAGVVVESDNWLRQGQKRTTSPAEHRDPAFHVQPRWWARLGDVGRGLPRPAPPALLAFKNVTSPTNQRSVIAAMIPAVGVINSAPLVLTGPAITQRRRACLLANLNAFVLDYVARQKIGNVNLNFFILEQLPLLPPGRYDGPCPWEVRSTLEQWVARRALALTCTSDELVPLAEAAGVTPRVNAWDESERALLKAQLDAAFFHLYGVARDDVGYILGTFQGVADEDAAHGGAGPTRRLILEAYDRMVPAR